jgi:hypothetical protein
VKGGSDGLQSADEGKEREQPQITAVRQADSRLPRLELCPWNHVLVTNLNQCPTSSRHLSISTSLSAAFASFSIGCCPVSRRLAEIILGLLAECKNGLFPLDGPVPDEVSVWLGISARSQIPFHGRPNNTGAVWEISEFAHRWVCTNVTLIPPSELWTCPSGRYLVAASTLCDVRWCQSHRKLTSGGSR